MSSCFDPIHKNQSGWVSEHFKCALPDAEWKERISINDMAPFIYLDDGVPTCQLGNFGLIPPWTTNKKKHGAFTYRVKSEGIQSNGLYKTPWAQRKFGLVLANRFYEPLFDSAGFTFKLTSISKIDNQPMALACIWDSFLSRATGEIIRSFSLLTVNANEHPLMSRFQKPKDEKRTVVVIENADLHKWLNASHDQATDLIKPCAHDYLQST